MHISNMGLRNKIVLSSLLLVAFVLTICVSVSSYIVNREVKSISTVNINNTVKAIGNQLSNETSAMSSKIITLSNSSVLTDGLYGYNDKTILEKVQIWRDIDQLLKSWESFSGSHAVRLYLPESTVLLRDQQRYFSDISFLDSCSPYSTIYGTQYWRINSVNDTCSCFMPIIKNFKILGYVELEMGFTWYSPEGELQQSISRTITLIDSNGIVLLGSDIGMCIDAEYIVDCSKTDAETLNSLPFGSMYLTMPVEKAPFAVAASLDDNIVSISREKTLRLLLLFNIPVLVLSILIAFLLSTQMTTKLKRLSHRIQRIKEGDFSSVRGKPSNDEIDRLMNEFAQMSEQLNVYMEEIRQTEQIRKESELQILQHQINPHFISNALSSVDAMARRNDTEKVHLMLRSICDYLRLSFSKSWQISTVEKELQLIRTYWSIEQYCFDTGLHLSIFANPDILTMYIPPLIIQTLVENSILHGMKHGQNVVHNVDIRLSVSDDILIIEVEDNGQGMSEKRLEEVRMAIVSDEVSDCYGLWNVNRRVSERFGAEYGLMLESSLGVGTVCILTLPVMKTSEAALITGKGGNTDNKWM